MAHNEHGHTPAAWTTVILILAGFVVGCIAVILLNWPLFWIGGVGLVVVGGIVGKIMQMMGLGQRDSTAGPRQPAAVTGEDTVG
ncbi:HGxxPAAW family protein [Jiangella endophytica]|uniref:HGxxPAAW family protein n=1 Tax=Jiangella endophytica TaxID=1623398 RepID=UPI000E34F1D0|nr:HGxxPAAW family protein [Jiangella endophytica]